MIKMNKLYISGLNTFGYITSDVDEKVNHQLLVCWPLSDDFVISDKPHDDETEEEDENADRGTDFIFCSISKLGSKRFDGTIG